MEAGGIGVNSPEFLQKKIERLKTALDEANVLMDRQVTERDDARAQLEVVRRENEDLTRELEQLRAHAGNAPAADAEAAPEPLAIDPALEHELRDRIAQLEAERDRPTAEPDVGSSDDEQALRERADYLQRQLDDARRDLDAARSAADTARGDASSARADADAARRESQQAQATIAAGVRRPTAEPNLPAAGPFVSQEVIRDALDNDNFVLFCQPVFSLQAERITQYELLLRLRDENGRMVRPFSFLEPADRFGLMAEIDRWVVTRALDLLERDVSGNLRLEVNIGAQSLGDFELT